MARKLWVNAAGKVHGPFTASQLKQLARAGKLTEVHSVSEDKKRWTPARDVKGLTFKDHSQAATASTPSADQDELGLAELEEDEPKPRAMSWNDGPLEIPSETRAPDLGLADLLDDVPQPDSSSGAESLEFGASEKNSTSESMSVFNNQSAIGPGLVLTGSGSIILSPILFVLLSISDASSSGLLEVAVVVVTLAFVMAFAILAIGIAGSRVKIDITINPSGQTYASVTNYFAFLPVQRHSTAITVRDLLVVRRSRAVTIGLRGSYFLLSGQKRSSDADLTLELRTREHPTPIFLCRRLAENYVNVRLDTPDSFERIIDLFRKVVPNLDVQDQT